MSKLHPYIADTATGMVELRRQIHARPELSLEEAETSELVAGLLTGWGFAVHRGLAGTGVVATLKVGTSERTVGLRADMDALPITECTGLPYASTRPGIMHACGHDGHTAMLLSAARCLAATRAFDGTVHLIFQPAEERYNGAKIMMDDGLFEKFQCDRVFAMHNMPSYPKGQFGVLTGPLTSSSDTVYIKIHGAGGHGARPSLARDPIVAAAHIITALQTIVSRNTDPADMAVVTVGKIAGGTAGNVIPELVELELSVRALSPDVQQALHDRLIELVQLQASALGCTAEVDYQWGCPAVVNDADAAEFVRAVVRSRFGDEALYKDARPTGGAEDFAFMLQAVPGCYVFMGTGDGHGCGEVHELHNPRFDFNDECLPIGATFWVELVERALPRIDR
ncbi:amidohydrolase [Caballeronia arvi]|uniref:Amidohydrolase n=1 Tax=Caballeronia arvi TaxID=1777135 RepID=A0A158KSI7_9BURK|nr:M20 aminoacylase family protein [Caballeronia arvi]SAL83560.1 amidohydrolase [Caballeronia arvi]